MLRQKLTGGRDLVSEISYWAEFDGGCFQGRLQEDDLEQKHRLASSHLQLRTSMRNSAKMKRLSNERKTEILGGVANYDYPGNKIDLCAGKLMARNIDYFMVSNWLQMVEPIVGDKHKHYLSEANAFFQLSKIRMSLDLHSRLINLNHMSPAKLTRLSRIGDTVASVDRLLEHRSQLTSETIVQDVKDLVLLLNNVHMRNVVEIISHVSSMFGKGGQDDTSPLKVVSLYKDGHVMGMTVESEMGSIFVSRIVSGGQVDQCGVLNVRDELISVNGHGLSGMSVDEAQLLLRRQRGHINFVMMRGNRFAHQSSEPAQIYLRTLFTYNAEDDEEIPCAELGISFNKRAILAVTDTSDEHWWQVSQEDENGDSTLGIIPSPAMQHCREREKKRRLLESKKRTCFRKVRWTDSEVLPSYDQVVLHYPDRNNKSVIILAGPDNDTMGGIMDDLLKTFAEMFIKTIKHTTRKKRREEIDGLSFHFVSSKSFRKAVLQGKFFEYSFAKKEKCFYGTQISTIRKAIPMGKHCLIHLPECQSLRNIQDRSFFSYVVFIGPPNIQILRDQSRGMGEQELRDIIDRGRFLEDKFGRYIDQVIVNKSLPHTIHQIMHTAKMVDSVPQWIPIKWMGNA